MWHTRRVIGETDERKFSYREAPPLPPLIRAVPSPLIEVKSLGDSCLSEIECQRNLIQRRNTVTTLLDIKKIDVIWYNLQTVRDRSATGRYIFLNKNWGILESVLSTIA